MDGWHAFELALGALVALLWWQWRRLVIRQDSCVTQEQLDRIIAAQDERDRIRNEIRERQHDDNKEQFKDVKRLLEAQGKALGELNVSIARIPQGNPSRG